jgi:tetratricopeptide (TPR) repeat protein
MILLRIRLALLSLILWSTLQAQERSAAVTNEIEELGAMLRSAPPEVALQHIDSLLALPPAGQDPFLRVGLHNFKGHALRLLGKLDEALDEQVRAFEMADSLKDGKGRIEAQMAIGIIYLDRGEIDKARYELVQVYALSEARPADRNSLVPLALGAIETSSGRLDSALFWYAKALPMAEAAGDSMTVCNILFNMAVAHGKRKDLAARERNLLATLSTIPAAGYPQLEARTYEALADLYLDQQRWDEVPALLDKSQELAQAHGAGDLLEYVLTDRMRYHQGVGNTAAALQVSQRLIEVKDSLASILSEEALAEARSKFDVERMEKELALTKAEAEVNALRAQRSWIAWGALAVIVILATVLIVQYRQRYLAKKKAAHALEGDKERLLEENELLHQENLMARFETLKSQIDPHFLFNAMNTLYTLVETEPKKAREFVSSFSALYRKVLTSRERTIVPVQEELELVHHYLFLQRIRFGESLRVNVEVPAHALKGYLPPFTLQMLLENAIKHNVISAAHPLHITITVEGDHLIVRNDLLPRSSKEAGTGTGLENIRRRYVMLGAAEPTFTVSDPYYTASVPILAQES